MSSHRLLALNWMDINVTHHLITSWQQDKQKCFLCKHPNGCGQWWDCINQLHCLKSACTLPRRRKKVEASTSGRPTAPLLDPAASSRRTCPCDGLASKHETDPEVGLVLILVTGAKSAGPTLPLGRVTVQHHVLSHGSKRRSPAPRPRAEPRAAATLPVVTLTLR